MKILLVEDSATLRHAMRSFIVEAGHTPLMARSGEEALQLLENTPVDMIIMDVEMPGLDGFETTRLIREWLGDHWIPIIFVTGRNEDDSYREGIEAGGDDYLIKPVSFTIINAKIRAMARIADMRDQLNKLNGELEALSQLDSLTMIYNRRTFNEQALQLWAQAKRNQQPISALMIDLDHFKLYNDHYGHPAGDSCLKKITQVIKSCLQRSCDLFGRYGGEEFIVLLPETDTQGAYRVAQTINSAIATIAIRHDVSPTEHYVTASIGGASCTRTTGHNLEDLIKHADRALYKAKRSGRNRAWVDELVTQKNVLIAATNAEIVRHFSILLEQHFNLSFAASATECINIAEETRPNIMLLDEQLADAHEAALCKSLREGTKTRNIPMALILKPTGSTQSASEIAQEKRADRDQELGIYTYVDAEMNTSALLNHLLQVIN
jgi:diguanylate cyclase (GGDEF)-like protein